MRDKDELVRMDCLEILANFDAVLDRVESGESIRIERDGRVVARFVPFGPDEAYDDVEPGDS